MVSVSNVQLIIHIDSFLYLFNMGIHRQMVILQKNKTNEKTSIDTNVRRCNERFCSKSEYR